MKTWRSYHAGEEKHIHRHIAQLSSVTHPEDPTQPRQWLFWHTTEDYE